MARAGPGPGGGPDMATVFLLFYTYWKCACHREVGKDRGALRIEGWYEVCSLPEIRC
jgi:hypothetical protein